MSGFEKRLELTQIIEDKMQMLFPNTVVKEFGCQSIIGDDEELNEFIKSPEINQMASGMIVKFAPDYILLRKNPKELFFVDVKHSISPIWASSRIKKIRERNDDPTLQISDVGVIAREALLSYRRYYPNSIVLMASPYNPKLIMAQYASKIRCLYCYRSNGNEYDCSNCPSKMGGFFDIERATDSQGSQTPMTDVDLRSFEPMKTFFEKIGIQIDDKVLNVLTENIKDEHIEIDNKVYDYVVNHVLWELNESGCSWVDYELYAKEGNDFLHINRECSAIKKIDTKLITYASLSQAQRNGKNRICMFCGKKY